MLEKPNFGQQKARDCGEGGGGMLCGAAGVVWWWPEASSTFNEDANSCN